MGWNNARNVFFVRKAKEKNLHSLSRKANLGNGRRRSMVEGTDDSGLGDVDLPDLEPSIAYLTAEGFIEWYFDKDGELCLRLSEAAIEMDF
jgi:hypothetical protein